MVDIFSNPQHPTTKEFTKTVTGDIPDAIKRKKLSPTYTEGSSLLAQLTFIGDSADEPVVSGLIKRFDVEVSILFGNISELKNTPYGTLIVEIEGDHAAIDKALQYLKERDLKLEVLGYESANA